MSAFARDIGENVAQSASSGVGGRYFGAVPNPQVELALANSNEKKTYIYVGAAIVVAVAALILMKR